MEPFVAYLNGRYIPPSEAVLPIADLGFRAGVTVVDNCRTYNHRLFRWPDHRARFRRDCAACHVPLTGTDVELTAVAAELVRRNVGPGGDLQLVTFATPGPPDGLPTLGMYTYPVPVEKYRPFFESGVHLVTAGCHPTGPGLLLPPRVKHRSRMVWWLAEHVVPPGTVAVLTADPAGNVLTETAISNLLLVVDGAVVASDPAYVLDGISVRVVRELCTGLAIPFREAPLTRALVRDAAEAMLAGTGFGLAGVCRVDDSTIPWPGPVYLRLLAAWSDLVGVDVAGQFR
jgi:branched-subunit amino acid aminotransferase/4-amino-4-deoxychorismate lyase